MRFCFPWKSWLVWDGRRWMEDQTGEAVRRVKGTQGALHDWAAEQIRQLKDLDDKDERKARLRSLNKLLGHALRWEDASRIRASLEMAKSEPDIPILPDQLDTDPWLLNVSDGTLDLRTGMLREHRREDLLTKLAPVAFDPEAKCPLREIRCKRSFAMVPSTAKAEVEVPKGRSSGKDRVASLRVWPHGAARRPRWPRRERERGRGRCAGRAGRVPRGRKPSRQREGYS